MEPEHWALLAAVAAPGWVAAGLVIAGLTDWVSQTLFQRAGFGLGLGIVFAATLLLNAGEGAGGIGRLVGIALGAFFCVGLGTCAVLLPIFYIRHRRDLRGQGSDAQGRAR
ncbi:MAG: hypothetical protein HY924_02270 [Elusimicrobia bacterium]|nr:hypothetical protein [Elusimicrobiota bacterium]